MNLTLNSPADAVSADYAGLVHHWILKLLVPMGGHRKFLREHGVAANDVLIWLGVGIELDEEEDEDATDKAKEVRLLSRLKNLWRDSEHGVATLHPSSPIAANLQWLADALGLTDVEREILLFRMIAQLCELLETVVDSFGDLNRDKLCRFVSQIIGRPTSDVRQALDPAAALARTGVLRVDSHNMYTFTNKLDLLKGLADAFCARQSKPYDLFRGSFTQGTPSKLTAADYSHVSADVLLLKAYLTQSLKEKRIGVNILVYGPPGTGKTELTRVLSSDCGAELFEIATEGVKGDTLDGGERMGAFQLAQHLLSGQRNRTLLFDEVEDAFIDGDFSAQALRSIFSGHSGGGASSGQKARVNQMLESNPVPAFWLANDIDMLDAAFLRRFDYVLKLASPPKSIRRKIWEASLKDMPVSAEWKNRMAAHESVSPASIERASNVVAVARRHASALDAEQSLERILGSQAQAAGHRPLVNAPVNKGVEYRVDVLNTDADLSKLTQGLKRHSAARLALYGPPGTGKTAFAHWLAAELGKPLLVKRASDLLGKYVGATEKNMAAAFQEAQHDGAVLLLDEADSFLRDRNSAHQSWEVTSVNEMLTQLEAFSGIFIASTNLVDVLDAAALRRFDMKIRFDYLLEENAWNLFQQTVESLSLKAGVVTQNEVARLHCLAPGDFATILRQSRVCAVNDARDLYERLQAECRMKPAHSPRRMGFL